MYPFQYHRPGQLPEAKKLFGAGSDSKYIAGGMTLLPTMKQRLANPSDLIDLAGLPDLTGIKMSGHNLVIGSMTTHSSVASSETVRKALPALAVLAGGIGDPHVRHRGTIGGSIANNDPSADYPAGVLGLGAIIDTDRRTILAEKFFLGMFETALEPDEIITQVSFPIPKRAGYCKFPNPVSRYAMVGVFAADLESGPRVAVTGAGTSVFRQTDFEKRLAAEWSAGSLQGVKQSSNGLIDDIHGSSEYRAHLVNVIARRAVDAALRSTAG